VHAKKFTVDVRLWIATGSVKQVRLANSSGSRDIDGGDPAALDSMGRLDEAPPIEIAQPSRANRGAHLTRSRLGATEDVVSQSTGSRRCLWLAMATPCVHAADSGGEQQSLEELRNTVVNLLQALVDKGLMTREQAEQLVKQAQQKAAADAAAKPRRRPLRARRKRMPCACPTCRRSSGRDQQGSCPTGCTGGGREVVKEAKEEKWVYPAALPDWISHVQVSVDITFREQNDMYAKAMRSMSCSTTTPSIRRAASPRRLIRISIRPIIAIGCGLRARFGGAGGLDTRVDCGDTPCLGSLTFAPSEVRTKARLVSAMQ